MPAYQYEVVSVHALVQQLATSLLPNGYWFYKTGTIPEGKSPEAVDRKLLEKYDIAVSRATRFRRKAAGIANLHYLRVRGERWFLLIATQGKHRFLVEESNIRDIRRDPLLVEGYSVAFKQGGYLQKPVEAGEPVPDPGWHSRVQIARKTYTEIKSEILDIALKYSAESLGDKFYRIDYEPYAPVRQQLLNLLRVVNEQRKTAGLETIPSTAIRYQRRILKPFARNDESIAA